MPCNATRFDRPYWIGNGMQYRPHWYEVMGAAMKNYASRKPDPLVVPSGGKGCWKMTMGDLNEDGFLDVVTPNVESMNLTILLSRKR